MSDPPAVLAEALKLAAAGIPVFPCSPLPDPKKGKRPLVPRDKDGNGKPINGSGGLKKATCDEAQIRAWWKKWPKAMIGVPMGEASGLVAIDPDRPKNPDDPDGVLAFSKWTAEHGDPGGRVHATPHGGRHYIFTFDRERPLGNGDRHVSRFGVNVRGDGGYVCWPPSHLTDGKSYAVVADIPLDELPPMPGWLYLKIRPPISQRAKAAIVRPNGTGHGRKGIEAYLERALDNEVRRLAGITHGRNNALAAAAFSLGQLDGLSDTQISEALLSACTVNGLMEEEPAKTEDTLARCLAAGRANPRDLSHVGTKTLRKPNGNDGQRPDGGANLRFVEDRQAEDPPSEGPDATPDWRERTKRGDPRPSLYNARLAIEAIGVSCSYDTFHSTMLFGYRGGRLHNILQPLVGEVSDDSILSLRRVLSDQFGFDLTERHMRDAVKSLALEHCFDPVADMLAKAEAHWDGVERLGRMAPDYLNTEDTTLNRACWRKFMIAAVARVRKPGIKFDPILVLESPEGWNKSFVFQVLAGDPDNFSDEQIIGKNSREVQENLATIWIHENADLGGMKKAEVEMVKAFASRTVDRARPAYGHFFKKQPRHSVEAGTTNNEEYLQSQTGNRRFWGMKVLAPIDIEKLKKDRLQLWGEAAHYQSQGESLVLDRSLWSAAGVEQERRRVRDPWEDVLDPMPETVWSTDVNGTFHEVQIVHRVDGELELVASQDILLHVLKVQPAQLELRHTMRLSPIMKRLGWQRPPSNSKLTIGGQRVRGYFRPIGKIEND